MDGPMAQSPPLLPGDATDLADDIRELFDDLSRKGSGSQGTYSGDCHPSLDVRETELTVEVTIDVAGVPAESIRVLFRSGVLLIAGDKTPARHAGASDFSSRREGIWALRTRGASRQRVRRAEAHGQRCVTAS